MNCVTCGERLFLTHDDWVSEPHDPVLAGPPEPEHHCPCAGQSHHSESPCSMACLATANDDPGGRYALLVAGGQVDTAAYLNDPVYHAVIHALQTYGLVEAPSAHLKPGHGMNPWQRMVAAFHDAMELPVGDTPEIRMPELRAKLLMEETAETVAALGFHVDAVIWEPGSAGARKVAQYKVDADENLAEVIDGLCDIVYVALGAAATFGVDLDVFFREVQRSNMAKVGGERREDGKRLKPEGWTPPDIEGILAKVSDANTLWAMYRRLAAEYDKDAKVPDLGDGVPGDRYP
jgi:predicted HAD superfamily Cof-like phosphohydrolase